MIPSYNAIDNKWKEIKTYAKNNHVVDTVQFIKNFEMATPDLLYKVASLYGKMTSENPLCHSKFYQMFQHVHAMKHFVEPFIDLKRRSFHLKFTSFGFTECCCTNSVFHRIKSPRRNNLDAAIVDRLRILDKTQPIQLLSMGSGGLMADFILLEKLILEGFKSITLDCVEPCGIEESQIIKLRTFFEDIPDVTVKVEAFKDISEVPQKEYMCVTAIDYSEIGKKIHPQTLKCTADLMRAYSRLPESGFLVLGYAQNEDNLFGPTLDPILLSSSSSVYQIAMNVIKLLLKKEELVFLLPTLTGNNLAHQAMMCVSLASRNRGLKRVDLNIQSSAIDKDRAILPDFEKMMDVMFPNIFKITLGDESFNPKADIIFTL